MAQISDITKSTSRIENRKANGSLSTGTGMFWRYSDAMPDLWVVTNRHVVEGASSLSVTFDTKLDPPNENIKSIIIAKENPHIIVHPDSNVDLAAIWLPPYLGPNQPLGAIPKAAFVDRASLVTDTFLNEIGPVEPIIMVGYPNGLWDEANNAPVVRQGITATAAYRKYKGNSEFMIDCACYPGSSGSPIYIHRANPWVNRKTGSVSMGNPPKALAGILYSGPTITKHIQQKNSDGLNVGDQLVINNMMHLGHVIDAREILAMEPAAKALISTSWKPN